jgi:hypothetical protein
MRHKLLLLRERVAGGLHQHPEASWRCSESRRRMLPAMAELLR